MMSICQRFASCHNLKFSTHIDPVKSKTKCIHFSRKKIDLAGIELNGTSLPWVDSAHHVGNIMERDNSFSKDIRMKRGSFIGRVHSIFQEFHFANPVVKMKMLSLYTTSFYGSSLWNLFDGHCDRLFSAWNNSVRDAFGIPRTSHRYFVEEISEHLHPMVTLASRFLKFHHSLQKCSKPSVRFLSFLSSQNQRTGYCQNLSRISEQVQDAGLSCSSVKKYCEVPDDQKWRVALVKDLLEMQWNNAEIDVINEQVENIDAAIENLVVM